MKAANHLHEILETIAAGRMLASNGMTPEQHRAAEIGWPSIARRAICFDAGDADALEGLQKVTDLFRLPFQTTYIELTFQPTRVGSAYLVGVLAVDGNDGCAMLVSARLPSPRQWGFIGVIDARRYSDGLDATFSPKNAEGELMDVLECVWQFLSALNCTNVSRHEHRPDARLQVARSRRGKLPLFSTWTLNLELPRTLRERADIGGTHVSPRVHLRRGHPRQFAPGKWTWVQPHVVGNGPGIVHKDYAARHTGIPDVPLP